MSNYDPFCVRSLWICTTHFSVLHLISWPQLRVDFYIIFLLVLPGKYQTLLRDSLSQRANYNPFTIAVIRCWGQMTLLMIGQWPLYLINTHSHWLRFNPRSPGWSIFTFESLLIMITASTNRFLSPVQHLGANITPSSTPSITFPSQRSRLRLTCQLEGISSDIPNCAQESPILDQRKPGSRWLM